MCWCRKQAQCLSTPPSWICPISPSLNPQHPFLSVNFLTSSPLFQSSHGSSMSLLLSSFSSFLPSVFKVLQITFFLLISFILPHWILHGVNFWDIRILLYVRDVDSFSRGCPVDKCGLRVVGRSLGWDLFSTKHSGLNLESLFISCSQLKSQLRMCWKWTSCWRWLVTG